MRRQLCAAAALTAAAAPALAQEAISTPAATQPSAGRFVLREQLRLESFDAGGEDPRDIDQVTLWTRLSYGVTGALSLSLDLPMAVRETSRPGGDDDTDAGLEGPELTAKLRVLREDFGPIDTLRVSLLAGVAAPVDDHLGPPGITPTLGAVATYVHGRHGLNGAVRWSFTTDSADDPVLPGETLHDLLRADAAYLYRLAPAAYTADTRGAWYAVLELNTFYETGGDFEALLAPGLMYEGRRWAAELSVQIPVHQDLDHRPELEYRVIAGLRFLF
jgi:hypothetical protein